MGVHRYGRGAARSAPHSRSGKAPRSWWWELGLRWVRVGDELLLWVQPRWSPVPQRVHVMPFVAADEPGARDLAEEVATYMLRKSDVPKPPDLMPAVSATDGFAQRYPVTWAYMTQTNWEDGSPRETSSILLFLDGGVFKIMLRDKAAGMCLWVASPSMLSVFDVLEAKLCDPNADWRVDRQQNGQAAKRVRRNS